MVTKSTQIELGKNNIVGCKIVSETSTTSADGVSTTTALSESGFEVRPPPPSVSPSRPTSLDLSRNQSRSKHISKKNVFSRLVLPPAIVNETSFSTTNSSGRNSKFNQKRRKSDVVRGSNSVQKRPTYVTLASKDSHLDGGSDGEDSDTDSMHLEDYCDPDTGVGEDILPNDRPGDLTDGLVFNVFIGIAIMVVVLCIGSAMLYTVQKILMVSTHRTSVHSLYDGRVAVSAFSSAAMDNPFITKLLHHRNHIVHPKDLSSYLSMERLEKKVKNKAKPTASSPTELPPKPVS